MQFSNAPEIFAKAERLFAEVQSSLSRLLPGAEIHHVGSTAICGTLTKGDLDVVVRVARESFPEAEQVLASIFYRNMGSSRDEGFSAFVDKSTDPELGVQLVVVGSPGDTFLAWRQRLEENPMLRREYDLLKRQFQGRSMDAYREAKSRFIAENLQCKS